MVIRRVVRSISYTCYTSNHQSVCWSPHMHNIFVHMQNAHLDRQSICTQEEPQH
jgi:hypothetical protein